MTIVANPRAYKIPDWFLNRQKDIKDGRYSQVRRAGASPPGASCLPGGRGAGGWGHRQAGCSRVHLLWDTPGRSSAFAGQGGSRDGAALQSRIVTALAPCVCHQQPVSRPPLLPAGDLLCAGHQAA